MKFIKKRNQYEASNVTCNLKTMQAYSYGWWLFLTVHNGKVIFNEHRFSPSTGKQQSKVRSLLAKNGVKIDLYVNTRVSLSSINIALTDAIIRLKEEKQEISEMLENNRRKKALDVERLGRIDCIKDEIQEIEEVLHGSKLGAVVA